MTFLTNVLIQLSSKNNKILPKIYLKKKIKNKSNLDGKKRKIYLNARLRNHMEKIFMERMTLTSWSLYQSLRKPSYMSLLLKLLKLVKEKIISLINPLTSKRSSKAIFY
jgi:hypothetical protein